MVLLARQGLHLSASRVGRILAYLRRTRQLLEPLRRFSARRRQWKRQYATRKPRGYEAKLPGDIVQLDTMDVRPEPGVVLKQFTAVDVVSRWSVPTIAGNATATLATKALDAIIARSPFPIRAIQVDGGSEFMAGFEDARQQKGILLRTAATQPQANGRVERANRHLLGGVLQLPLMQPPPSRASRAISAAGNTPTTTSARTRLSASSPPPNSSTATSTSHQPRECH
ncbi:MAG: DDE-type integrase/transposase/recombinase [Thermoflexaceae bacterium]|nr:DDE-type integrase/transposase/recombinase [Thermoflexaceae bacterium]